MDIPVFHAFTYTHNSGLARRLLTPVTVISDDKSKFVQVDALWDTGATCTCISHETVSQLALVPTGMMTVKTASGTEDVKTYLINIGLPNHIAIEEVRVCDSAIGEQGIGMLIGMDIISMGDFSVTNRQNTVFSFRIPSIKEINYVREAEILKLTGTHGKGKGKRNSKHRR